MMSAVLIRRHRNLLSRAFFRSLATTKATAESSIPRLLVTCPPNPEKRYLYTLAKEKPTSSVLQLKLDRELHLPEIASNWIIGSSHGYLISMPLRCGIPREIHAIDPITGASNHIPVSPQLTGRVKACKAILSPSLHKLALLPDYCTKQIGLADLIHSSPSLSPWTRMTVPDYMDSDLHDCVFHKDDLYITDAQYSVVRFDTSGCSFLWSYIYEPREEAFGDRSLLVESPDGNDLYLIAKTSNEYGRKNFHFKVFKLDESAGKWENVDSTGDLAVFVGRKGAVSVHALRHSPLLKPNCIYFFGDDYRYEEPGTQSISGVYYLNSKRFKHIGASDDHHILNPAYPSPILFQPNFQS